MTSRGFVLALFVFAAGCAVKSPVETHLDEIIDCENPEQSRQMLARFLWRQGVDPNPYLGNDLFPTGYGAYRFRGKSYCILWLSLGKPIQGSHQDRFLLLDPSGRLLDVATVLLDVGELGGRRAFISHAEQAWDDNLLLLILGFRGTSGAPVDEARVVLHTTALTGESVRLGVLAVENERFAVVGEERLKAPR